MSETIKIVRCEHPLIDSGDHFVVDTQTRSISHPNPKSLVLVQGDANSEVYTICIPKLIDNHPVNVCNRVTIHYINTGDNKEVCEDIYEILELKEYPDDDENLYAEWILSRSAAMFNGNLSFAMNFMCVADDEDGTVLYSWSTLPFTGISVGRTITNTESVYSQYSNILAEWYNKLVGAEESLDGAISKSITDAQKQVEDKGKDVTAILSQRFREHGEGSVVYYLNLHFKISDWGSSPTYITVTDIPIALEYASQYMTLTMNKSASIPNTLNVYLEGYYDPSSIPKRFIGYAGYDVYGDASDLSEIRLHKNIQLDKYIEGGEYSALSITCNIAYNIGGLEDETESRQATINRVTEKQWSEQISTDTNIYYIDKVKTVQPLVDATLKRANQYTDTKTLSINNLPYDLYMKDYSSDEWYRIYIFAGELQIEQTTEPYKEE